MRSCILLSTDTLIAAHVFPLQSRSIAAYRLYGVARHILGLLLLVILLRNFSSHFKMLRSVPLKKAYPIHCLARATEQNYPKLVFVFAVPAPSSLTEHTDEYHSNIHHHHTRNATIRGGTLRSPICPVRLKKNTRPTLCPAAEVMYICDLAARLLDFGPPPQLVFHQARSQKTAQKC